VAIISNFGEELCLRRMKFRFCMDLILILVEGGEGVVYWKRR